MTEKILGVAFNVVPTFYRHAPLSLKGALESEASRYNKGPYIFRHDCTCFQDSIQAGENPAFLSP